jgi:threonine dehydratase
VNTDASPAMWLSRREGRPHLTFDSRPTIADGLEGGVGRLTFQMCQRVADEVVLARESTVRRAVAELAVREHLVVEGGGAAGVAALLDGRVAGPSICVVLTGGNIDPRQLGGLLAELAP